MATLYEIDQSILSLIDEETGEIIDAEALERLQLERSEKLENIALYIKNLQADVIAYKAEKATFEAKQKRAETTIAALKGLLLQNGEKFKTARVNCCFRNSESVNVLDLSRIPSEYLRQAEPTADKIAIKAALQSGKTVEGAEIVTNTSVIIK